MEFKEVLQKFTDAAKQSRKLKHSLDADIQNELPTFYIKRKSYNTAEELEQLCAGTSFKVIGDPVGEFRGKSKYFFCECKECHWRKNLYISYLLDKTVNCSLCLILKHKEEASRAGLELEGPSTTSDSKQRLYRFSSCGHFRNIATGDVRAGNVSCTECYDNKVKLACEERGFINLGRPDSTFNVDATQFYHVEYKTCGHKRLVLQQNLLYGSVGECEICQEKELSKYTEIEYGIKVLSKASGTKRKILLMECGHEKIVGLSNLKSGHVQCTICQEARFSKEAELAGLTYIGNGIGKGRTYLAPCGHELLRPTSAIRYGHWSCQECNSSYLDRPNKLYLYKITSNCGFQFIKLGYSVNPEYRKYDYCVALGTIFDLVKTVSVPTGRIAIKIENALHKKYDAYNLDSKLMKNYLKLSGHTECYPVSILDDILRDLREIEETENYIGK